MRIAALTLALAAVTAFMPVHSADAKPRGRHTISVTMKDGKVHTFRTMIIGGQRMVLVPMADIYAMAQGG